MYLWQATNFTVSTISPRKAAPMRKKLPTERRLWYSLSVTLENLFTHIEAGKTKEVNIIIRADVQGSVDVLTKYLAEISTNEVQIKILHAAVAV